jgi:ZIP family zinc transporter
VILENLAFVFVAGLITALATGIGALPFFIVSDISRRWTVYLWGLASGIMVSASVFGLIIEAEAFKSPVLATLGVVIGIVIVEVADRILEDSEIDPREYEEAEFKKLILILGILTVHSFPEGVAVGVSFAELGLGGSGVQVLGFAVPILAVYMTVAISIHNIPEGISISIPLRNLGVSEYRMVGWSIFSSLPQPIGAVIAYVFVTLAKDFLPIGYGFAAGAMVYLVVTEFIPEAREEGQELENDGMMPLTVGVVSGIVVMLPLLLI